MEIKKGTPVLREDCIALDKVNYELRRYRFYWRYTHDEKFLYLYQKKLKKFYEIVNMIGAKYFNKTVGYFYTDLANELIFFSDKEEDLC